MVWVDIAILALIGVSTVIGLVRGLVREVLSLIAWVAAFWVAIGFAGTLEPHLGFISDSDVVRAIAAFTILFVVVPVLLGIDALGEPETRTFQFVYQILRTFFVVGLGEELIWRGFVLGKASAALGSENAGIIASSVLFGLWHYPAGQDVLQVIATGLTRPQASALAAARRAARSVADESDHTFGVTLAPLAEQARLTTADALAA